MQQNFRDLFAVLIFWYFSIKRKVQGKILIIKKEFKMKTEQPILITSITAAADLSDKKNLFIGFDGDVCGNGAKALGVLNANTDQGEEAPVATVGILLVYSGAAVNQGDKIQSDANGKAITYAAGAVNGYSMDSAGGADELIRVLLCGS
jgi:Uncharacterized conserved protein (DUF2190)